MEISRLLDYSDRCRAAMAPVLRAAPPETLAAKFETTSRFDSILSLLAHSNAAEERWLARLEAKDGAARPAGEVSYEERRAGADLETILADAAALRARTRAAVSRFKGGEWTTELTVPLGSSAEPLRLSPEEIAFQILSHEQWHRGQISLLLQRAGIEPPNFDYVLLKP